MKGAHVKEVHRGLRLALPRARDGRVVEGEAPLESLLGSLRPGVHRIIAERRVDAVLARS